VNSERDAVTSIPLFVTSTNTGLTPLAGTAHRICELLSTVTLAVASAEPLKNTMAEEAKPPPTTVATVPPDVTPNDGTTVETNRGPVNWKVVVLVE